MYGQNVAYFSGSFIIVCSIHTIREELNSIICNSWKAFRNGTKEGRNISEGHSN